MQISVKLDLFEVLIQMVSEEDSVFSHATSEGKYRSAQLLLSNQAYLNKTGKIKRNVIKRSI